MNKQKTSGFGGWDSYLIKKTRCIKAGEEEEGEKKGKTGQGSTNPDPEGGGKIPPPIA